MKYSYAKRLEVVQSVLSGQESLCSAARRLGTDHKYIRRWVALDEHHGEEELRMKSGSYGVEFKLSVIRYMEENHLFLFETSVKFGIPNDSNSHRRRIAPALRQNGSRRRKQNLAPIERLPYVYRK
jgi:transposase-like protein